MVDEVVDSQRYFPATPLSKTAVMKSNVCGQ
jgi:hypothetical protein